MPTPTNAINEISKLLLAIDAGDATDADQRRFAELLEQHPEAIEQVAELLDQQAALADAERASTALLPAFCEPGMAGPHAVSLPGPTDRQRVRGRRYSRRLLGGLVGSHVLAALVAWAAFTLFVQPPGEESATGSSAIARQSQAERDSSARLQLASLTGCVWNKPEVFSARVGQQLTAGQVIDLTEGIATLDFKSHNSDSLARVRVGGPARLDIRDAALLELSYGAITVELHNSLQEVSIATPEVRLRLSGPGSIGVAATNEKTVVHAIDGDARFTARWADSAGGLVNLSQGDAAAFSSDRSGEYSISRFDASSSAFSSSKSMASDRLSLTGAYSEAVLDAEPDLYWRFERGESQTQNSGKLDGLGGVIAGQVGWHHSLDNRALELGFTPTPGLVVSEGVWPREPLEEYTVQFWAKPSHYHRGTMLALIGDPLPYGKHEHSLLLEAVGPNETYHKFLDINSIRYTHRPALSGEIDGESTCYSVSTYTPRVWQQIVARKQGKRLDLFSNGRVVASSESVDPLPRGTRVLLGQVFPATERANPRVAHRPFIGQLDEVALYSRALSDEEIRLHYNLATDPPPRIQSLPRDKKNASQQSQPQPAQRVAML